MRTKAGSKGCTWDELHKVVHSHTDVSWRNRAAGLPAIADTADSEQPQLTRRLMMLSSASSTDVLLLASTCSSPEPDLRTCTKKGTVGIVPDSWQRYLMAMTADMCHEDTEEWHMLATVRLGAGYMWEAGGLVDCRNGSKHEACRERAGSLKLGSLIAGGNAWIITIKRWEHGRLAWCAGRRWLLGTIGQMPPVWVRSPELRPRRLALECLGWVLKRCPPSCTWCSGKLLAGGSEGRASGPSTCVLSSSSSASLSRPCRSGRMTITYLQQQQRTGMRRHLLMLCASRSSTEEPACANAAASACRSGGLWHAHAKHSTPAHCLHAWTLHSPCIENVMPSSPQSIWDGMLKGVSAQV